jgi:NAD(P)-dependent dehydrogenase (short-subunit alcohol dehydrogenase family)
MQSQSLTDKPGIGSAIAEILASKGASLVLNYTTNSSKDRATALASKLVADYAVEVISVQADLGTEQGPADLVGQVRAHEWKSLPNFQIDIIVNNAGVGNILTIEESSAEDFDRQYHVNVRGPLFLIKSALPYLPHDRSGRIVNLSSVSATLGFPSQSVYGGTKAALEAMTRTWSRELAERATVNAVNPGPVATEMASLS